MELLKNPMSVGVDGLLAVETVCYALKDIVREKRLSEGIQGDTRNSNTKFVRSFSHNMSYIFAKILARLFCLARERRRSA